MARLALVLALVTLAAGCGPVVVSEVRFTPTPPFEPPAAGAQVTVEVRDGAPAEKGNWLGSTGTPSQGLPEHRYVLVGEESMAARLARDVVAALRARGYRAYQRLDPGPAPPADAIALSIRAVTHSIDIRMTPAQTVFVGTFAFECAATVGEAAVPTWAETINHLAAKQYFGVSMWGGSVARTFESVHWTAVVEIVRRFSAALPP
jgi:hypothetical protein